MRRLILSHPRYPQCSHTLLVLSPQAKQVWSHLEEVLSDSIPDIPIPTIYRQETHSRLIKVAPSLRSIVDSRKWHQGDRHVISDSPVSDDSDDWDICSASSTYSSPNDSNSSCLSQTDAAIALFAIVLLAGGLYVVTGDAVPARSAMEHFTNSTFGAFSRCSFRESNPPYTGTCRKPSVQFSSGPIWRGVSPIPRWLSPVLAPNSRMASRLGHSMFLSSSQLSLQEHSLPSFGRIDSQACCEEPQSSKEKLAPNDNSDLTAVSARRMKFIAPSSTSPGSRSPTGSGLEWLSSSNRSSVAIGLGMSTRYYGSPVASIAETYKDSLQPTAQEHQHLGRFDYAPIHTPGSVQSVQKLFTDPYIFAVPKTFLFRLELLYPSSKPVYILQEVDTSTQGYRKLMGQIKRYLSEKGIVTPLAEFNSGYSKTQDIQEQDELLQPEPASSPASENWIIAAYTGFSGEDTVLNPWDMIYAVQIAMACRGSVVNIRLRQFRGTEMDFGELVPSGCRLLRFRPFSQKSRLIDLSFNDLES